MTHRTVADVRLCDLLHGDGCLYAHVKADLLKAVRHAERIDDRSQHAHVVCTGTVHAAAASAAPEVAAAHNDGDLAAHIHDLLDGLADLDNGVKIDAVTDLAGKRFAAEL